MTELMKRIQTSVILFILLILALKYQYILALTLILIFHQILFEFQLMIKKIYNKKKAYAILTICTFYLFYFILMIWNNLYLDNNYNKIILLFIISICVFTDIGGYVFGKIFKGKKLTKISPKKTYSGMLGSYLMSLILTAVIFKKYFVLDTIIISVIIISTVSQLGDLFISYLKRKSKIKDTDKILPGHGGLLDRFDGIIFAIPFGLILLKVI